MSQRPVRRDGVSRRAVLRAVGVTAGAGLVSGPAAAGRPAGAGVGAALWAATDPSSVEFLAITPSTNVLGDLDDPDVTQDLIAIDPDDGSTRCSRRSTTPRAAARPTRRPGWAT